MNKIKRMILRNKTFSKVLITIKNIPKEYYRYRYYVRLLNSKECKTVFYLGAARHENLGDLAQSVCIRRWLKKNYGSYNVIEIETNALVNTHFSVLKHIKRIINQDDFIVFQSGYATTDLGGFADLMHQAVMKALPNTRILMMPQTIMFQTRDRKEQCSQTYNGHSKMLFLARDKVSFEMAKEMFPDINKLCYPDIVTTLIGTVPSNQDRHGIIFCFRNDGEKFYSDSELEALMDKCKQFTSIDRTDTTKDKGVVKQAEKFIYSEIEKYSKYKVMITDRYHGTILSLVAGTPVVIIKTTDHKVVTGADWFKSVYDDYVFLATDLDEAYEIAKKVYDRREYKTLKPYFEENYYDKLPSTFEEIIK